MARFFSGPPILLAPRLNLTEQHGGRFPSLLVFKRHSKKSDPQFVGRARVLREHVRSFPIEFSFEEGGFKFFPNTVRNR